MDITSLLNWEAIAAGTTAASTVTQAIKSKLPEKILPYVSIASALAGTFAYYFNPNTPPDYNQIVLMVINGGLGAAIAKWGYDFLSSKNSPPFTLPSKPTAPSKPPEIPQAALDTISKSLKEAFASLQINSPNAGVK